jgi:hypothetical protein
MSEPPATIQHDDRNLVEVSGLKKWFPIQTGFIDRLM